MQNSRRSLSADLIKTSAIFGVVYIHGSFLFGYTSIFSQSLVWLFRFAVPCFIILWAYFFEKSYQKKSPTERRQYLINRFTHLFIVYFAWSLLYFFIWVDWGTLTVKEIITAHFSGYGWSGQYFFIILFQLVVLFPLLRYLYSIKVTRYIILALTLIVYFIWGYCYSSLPAFIMKIGDRPFIFWIAYVFVGFMLAGEKHIIVNIILGGFVLLIPVEAFLLDRYSLDHSPYLTPIILLSSILFCLAMFQVKSLNVHSGFGKVISYIGKNTMTIFVANPLVIYVLSLFIIQNSLGPPSLLAKIVFPILSTIIVLTICLLISALLKKVRLNGILN